MGYDQDSTYDEFDEYDDSGNMDIPIWNSSSVYFDDEIVEYQGKRYIALKKTSAEMPGRCKAGIWKELEKHDSDGLIDISYEEQISNSMKEQEAQNIALQKAKKAEEIQQRSVSVKPKAPLSSVKQDVSSVKQDVSSVKQDVSSVQQKAPSVSSSETPVKQESMVKATISSVQNKQEKIPVKMTLKEREDDNNSKSVNNEAKAEIKMTASETPIQRKMTQIPNEQHIVNDILKEINFKKIKGLNSDENEISSNLILAQIGQNGTTLRWESTNPSIISAKGEVNRPEDGNDIAVNLSVTVLKNKASATRFFTLWVKAKEIEYSDEECVRMVHEALEFDHIKGANTKENSITQNLELLTHGLYDTEIYWASQNRELIDETGHFYKENLNQSTNIRIYAIISKNDVDLMKSFDLTLK